VSSLAEEFAQIFPDEVVTHAHVREVTLPHAAGTMALITLDNGHDHTRPNTFGPRGLAELDAALDQVLDRDDIAAVGIIGKPFVLAAGADITGMPRITTREHARAIARYGHEVFGKLGDGRKPTFAFINGLAIGGGLEIALHCTYRTVLASAPAVAFSECFLGILPGWGGTWLLPNLIGADGAVQIIVENALNNNRMLRGPQLEPLGLADATFDGVDFLERSLDWAARVLTGQVEVRRPTIDRGEAWDAAVARGRAFVENKLHGAAPAPLRALDIIEAAKTCSKQEGFALEEEALADLLMTEEFRASLYAFDLVQKRAKRPVGAPDASLARPVTKVGIVGAGLMASQLAVLFAHRLGVPVAMREVDDERAAAGRERVRAEIAGLVRAGRLDETGADRLAASVTIGTDLSALAGADLVIEAVTEVMAVKQRVFAEVEELVPDDAVLATNTSALSVTQMGAALRHPERVVGLHFFNPVARMPLLEVVHTDATDAVTRATAFELASRLGKSPVAVRDRPGFVVNRLLLKLLGDVLACVEDGTPVAVADVALHPLGLPMSPFTLLQLVGPQVAAHVLGTLHEGLGERYRLSPGLDRLAATGRPLMTRGPDGEDVPEAWVQEAFDEAAGRAPGTVPADAPDAQGVLEAVLAGLTKEIGELLDEQVVAGPEDVDVCMILGAGWPPHLGGITPYLDRTGWSTRLLGRRFRPVAG